MNSVDRITTEIIRNAFNAIADDMNAALIRSAFTPIIYEGKDCSVALLDAEANVLGQSPGLPLFLGNLEICVKLIAERHGWDHFCEGDVFYMNDSYMTGTHLNDSTIIMPIFLGIERIGFAASRAHWLDVGAKDPGAPVDSYEIYQEGMRWGPTRLYEKGEPREDVIDVLRRNSRFGEALIGDLNAQIAAGRTGEIRLRELFERFGRDTVLAARNAIFRQSEAREREAIRKIADGRYNAEGWLDDDGLGSDPVRVRVSVTVDGDTMTIDLSGSSEQTNGPVNCGFTQTVAAARVAFKLLIRPDDSVNGGSFRSLTVKARENTMFHAVEPAPCAWYFTPLGLMIDLVVKALAPQMPDRAAGAHYGDSMVVTIAGKDPRRENQRFLMVEPTTGGWGAFAAGDGADALINNVNGNFKDLPVEIFENKYPVLIQKYGIRIDSGGAGEYRGGNGTYRQYLLSSDARLSLWFERSVSTAWGLFGGGSGAAPNVIIEKPGEDPVHCLKVNSLALPAGTRVTTQTGGGGGYGHASDRDSDAVAEDIANEYVSLEAARTRYGLVLGGGRRGGEPARLGSGAGVNGRQNGGEIGEQRELKRTGAG